MARTLQMSAMVSSSLATYHERPSASSRTDPQSARPPGASTTSLLLLDESESACDSAPSSPTSSSSSAVVSDEWSKTTSPPTGEPSSPSPPSPPRPAKGPAPRKAASHSRRSSESSAPAKFGGPSSGSARPVRSIMSYRLAASAGVAKRWASPRATKLPWANRSTPRKQRSVSRAQGQLWHPSQERFPARGGLDEEIPVVVAAKEEEEEAAATFSRLAFFLLKEEAVCDRVVDDPRGTAAAPRFPAAAARRGADPFFSAAFARGFFFAPRGGLTGEVLGAWDGVTTATSSGRSSSFGFGRGPGCRSQEGSFLRAAAGCSSGTETPMSESSARSAAVISASGRVSQARSQRVGVGVGGPGTAASGSHSHSPAG
mmetsp:Transcript_2544/g.8539  ORF Transcript_2544/g.8539 Transcript_2544/m.8539 type:complete len:372 (+) Transcript_2544:644-1759(+)